MGVDATFLMENIFAGYREPCTLMTFKYSFPCRSPEQITAVKPFRAMLVRSVNRRFRLFPPRDLYTRCAD